MNSKLRNIINDLASENPDTMSLKAISEAEKAIRQAVLETMDRVGEPKLGDFDIKPESYDDVIKTINWYKSTLATLRKELTQEVQTDE